MTTNINTLASELESLNVSKSYICAPDQCVKYINVNNKNINIIHINICSINCNFDQFDTLLTSMNIQFDIIVLTECWLSITPYLPKLKNYKPYQTINNGNQNAGVVMYIRNNLDCKVSEPTIVKEADCLVCKFGTEIAIIALYRSPSYKNADVFSSCIDNLLISLKSYKTICLVGDINIDIKPDNKDNKSDTYLNLMASHGLLPTYTYFTRQNKCIDHIMLKSKLNSTAIVIESFITDHCPSLLSLQTSLTKCTRLRTRTKIDYEQIKHDLASFDFTGITQSHDANFATDLLISSVTDIINKNTIKYMPSRSKRNLKPWITPGLIRCMKNRDKMHMSLKRDPNNMTLKITYSRYRNYLNKLLKGLKNEYNKNLLLSAKNSKSKWKAIKDITNIAPSPETSKDLLKSSPDPINSVNEVNRFFVGIGKNLANKISQNNKGHSTSTTLTSPLNSFVLFNVDSDEIDSLIMNLRRDCAVGWDNISARILQSSRAVFVPILTHICQLSLSTGVFPKAFKKAIVFPVFKNGDRHDVSNYRPISVLTAMSKILEKVINSRLVKFLNTNNILSNNQFGFREGKSTEDAVIALVDDIVVCLEKKEKCLGLFLDLSKAFDTVSIPKLISKLEAVGVRGIALDLFRDYLSDRTQTVKIDEYTSEEECITTGVPQGSILGPTLFIIYINELCKLNLPHCNVFTYADDTALFVHGKTWSEVQNHAELALSVVMTWLSDNLLTLNLSKTNYMTFGLQSATLPAPDNFIIKAHTCQNITPNCTCSAITPATTTKYLGIILDRTLDWKAHIKALTSRIRKFIYVFKNLREVADLDTLKTTYFALCQSLIMYGVGIWGSAPKTTMLPLERAQRAVLKVITRKPYRHPTTLLYSDTKVLTVRQLFVLKTILRKHSQVVYDPNLNSNRRMQHRYKVCPILPHRTSLAKRNFKILSSKLYNKINKETNIYQCTKFLCKKRVQLYLTNLDYSQTENLLL